MIVVAIIAILAAVAIPQYQNYVARAAVTKAIGEVSALRTPVEECLSRGVDPSGDECDNVVYNSDPDALEVDIDAGGEGTLVLTVPNPPAPVADLAVTWTRSGDGIWECSTNVDDKYVPSNCQ